MSAKDKKIKELKAMLKAVEEREEMAIKETKMKFEEQIEEIFAEFRAREVYLPSPSLPLSSSSSPSRSLF